MTRSAGGPFANRGMDWPRQLRAMERGIGPDDEPDDEINCDPDSLLGEDDESGFEEMADWPDEAALEGNFDDAEGDDEDAEGEMEDDGEDGDADDDDGAG